MSASDVEAPGSVAAADRAQGTGPESAHSPAEATAARKRFANLQAELARRGYELRRADTGALLIVRWGLTRELYGIEAAENFARQVGAI